MPRNEASGAAGRLTPRTRGPLRFSVGSVAKHYYVYILTNPRYNVLYTGFTNDILSRVHQHRGHLLDGFTKRYNVTRLVYCEGTSNVWDAIQREKQIKGWTRARKIELIESVNPSWHDLAEPWFASTPAPDSSYLRLTDAAPVQSRKSDA